MRTPILRFTLIPFVVAIAVGSALMPETDVVKVDADGLGIVHTEPWRTRTSGVAGLMASAIAGVLALLRGRFDRVRRHAMFWPAMATAALLIASIALPTDLQGAQFAIVGAGSGLKECRQRVADIDRDINTNEQRDLELQREAAAIRSTTMAAQRPMNEDEEKRIAAIANERATLRTFKVDLLNDKGIAAAALTEAEARNETERNAPTGDDPDADTAARASASAGVRMGRNLAEDDPKRGFKDHKDYLTAVMKAGMGRVDQRLVPLKAAAGSDEQGVYNDAVGGFLVPHAIAPGVLSIAPESDPIAALCTPVTMTAPTVSFNARVDKDHSTSVSGGFTVTRRPETVDGTASRAKYEQVTLVANEEFGLAFASERLLTDSPTSFVSIIQAGFRDEYVANGMKERISGSGTGERQGILETGCKIKVSKETGQGAPTILKENIDKMAARCWRYGRAVWIANHKTLPQLKSIVQTVGTGGSAVAYFVTEGAPAGFDGLLDGRPLVFSEFAKTLGTEGDLILIIPSEYLEGTYQSEQYAESMHVRFVAAERAFRFYRRNDGQWWWRSALTPKNGDTLSPVVTLETR